MAHEYAHYLATRDRAEVTPVTQRRQPPESERFADAFAANFLMPRSGLSRRFHELKRSKDGKVTPATARPARPRLRVSVQALTLRLEDLRLVPSGTWDKLRDNDFQPRAAARMLGLEPCEQQQTPYRCTTDSSQSSYTPTARSPNPARPVPRYRHRRARRAYRNSLRPATCPRTAPPGHRPRRGLGVTSATHQPPARRLHRDQPRRHRPLPPIAETANVTFVLTQQAAAEVGYLRDLRNSEVVAHPHQPQPVRRKARPDHRS